MPVPKEITVYVDAFPEKPTFGDTNIVIPEVDKDRSDYLMMSRQFFIDRGRPEDAQKFYDAVNQTPSS